MNQNKYNLLPHIRAGPHRVELGVSALAVFLYYFVLHIMGIGCPIRYLTGISCAGCGMTRAWISVLKLDFTAAWFYHPLFLLPPVVVSYHLFWKQHITITVQKSLSSATIILFIFVYLLRMVYSGSEIVVFRPSEGLIMRGVMLFFGGMNHVLS